MNQEKERLFEQAFAFRKAKVWTALEEQRTIGLQLPNGKQSYFQVLGEQGEYCALILYPPDHPEETLYRMSLMMKEELTTAERSDLRCRLDCIHGALVTKDCLNREDEKEAREYAKANGLQFRGKNAFPRFTRYLPNHIPQPVTKESEMEELAFALEGACFLTEQLSGKQLAEMLRQADQEGEQLLQLSKADGQWQITLADSLELLPEEYVAYESQNEIAMKRLKGFPRRGQFQCQLLRLDVAVADETDEMGIPLFPVQLFALEPNEGYVMPIPTEGLPDDNYQSVLENWITALLEKKVCPKSVWVKDERTRLLLQNTCDKLHIPVRKKDSLPELEEFVDDFLVHLYEAEENGQLDEDYDLEWEDEDWDEEEETDEMWAQFLMVNEDIMTMPQKEIESFVARVQLRFTEMLSDPEVPAAVQDSIRRLLEKAHVPVPKKPAIQLLKRPNKDN
jgi:hypothetical protein